MVKTQNLNYEKKRRDRGEKKKKYGCFVALVPYKTLLLLLLLGW